MRRRICRAHLAVEKRDFAEQIAGLEVGKDNFPAFEGGKRDTYGADDHRHHAVAGIAKPAYRLAETETAWLGISGDFAPRFLVKSAK